MPRLTLLQRSALLALPFLLATAIGCKKEFDSPPERTLPVGSVVNMAQLRALFTGTPVHFSDTAGAVNTVYAVVTADEQDGNLYKNIYIQDHTAGIVMRIRNSGGLYRGDSIRIYLPGCVLSSYQSMLQLDSVDVDNNVVKQATGIVITPQPVSIAQITPDLQGRLISLSGVEFASSDTALTYSDAVGQTTVNRNIENCSGQTIIARISGYANYAAQHVPTGKGSLVATVGQFGTTMQLNIRSVGEVQMNGLRCGQVGSCDPASSLSQDFSSVSNNAAINLDCWQDVALVGSRPWRGRLDGSEFSAEATSSGSFDASNTMWLVTAPLQFNGSMNLSFSSEHVGYVHDGLSVWVSTDLIGAAVGTATWTQVNGLTIAGSANADNTWVPSGNAALGAALPSGYTGSFVVGFKYEGNAATQATTYRIDNVAVN